MYLTKYLHMQPLDKEQNLLINTLSGAIDIIENPYLQKLKKPELIDPESALGKALKERGYLFKNPGEEKKLLEVLYQKYAAHERPLNFVICPTYSCNLRCVYCFEGDLVASHHEVLNKEEINFLFKAIQRLKQEKAFIELFGGEPFLPITYQAVDYILKKAAQERLKVNVVTNGVNIPRFEELLKKYHELWGIFQVTLDGPKNLHDQRRKYASGRGTFDAIVSGIDLLLKLGLNVRVRVNIDGQNLEALPELAKFFEARGWPEKKTFAAVVAPVTDHKGDCNLPYFLSEDILATRFLKLISENKLFHIFDFQLFRTLDHIVNTFQKSERKTFPRFHYCEANTMDCYTFGPDGYIYPCSEAIGNPQVAIGGFYPDFFIDKARLAKWSNRGILTLEKCQKCKIATLCGGGCAYAALSINGSIDNPVCNNAQKTLEAYLESIKEELVAKYCQ